MKTEKSIKLKTGVILPKGLEVTFDTESPSRCIVHDGAADRGYRVRVTSAFNAPDMEALEEMSNDGVCESVAGESVEPDGWDAHGSPSWLLALGVI